MRSLQVTHLYVLWRRKQNCLLHLEQSWSLLRRPLIHNHSLHLRSPDYYRVHDIFSRIFRVTFRFSKKATKFETISHLIWSLISKCQMEDCFKFLRPFQNVRTMKNLSTFSTTFLSCKTTTKQISYWSKKQACKKNIFSLFFYQFRARFDSKNL